MANKQAIFTSNSDNWRTPLKLHNFFMSDLKCIDLFPFKCTYNEYDRVYKNQRLFINPPYSHLNTNEFRCFIYKLLSWGNEVYLLIPCRSDTISFQSFLHYCDFIYFFRGRLHFNDSIKASTFPSVLLRLCDLCVSRRFGFGTIEEFIERFSENGELNI